MTTVYGHAFGPIGVGLECMFKGRLVFGLLVTIGHGQRWGIHVEVGAVLWYLALHIVWEG